MYYPIQFHNVSFHIQGKPILCNINFKARQGEFITILGSNGAGKSTLLKILLGFNNATSGKISVFNQNLNLKNRILIRKKIAYMPQSFDVDRYFPILVKDVIYIGRTGIKEKKLNQDNKEIVDSIVKELKIKNLLEKPFGVISGGEKQKVMLAMVLVQNPEILLLDEPNLNLDLYAYKNFLNLVEKIYKHHQLTILFVTHLITHIPASSGKIIVIKNGHIIFKGSKENIFSKKDYLNFIYD